MITRVEKVHIDDLDEDVHTPALTKNHPDLSLKYSSCISIKMALHHWTYSSGAEEVYSLNFIGCKIVDLKFISFLLASRLKIGS